MIIGFIGNLGTGKTLSTVWLGEYLKENTNYNKVVSNFQVDYSNKIVSNPDELDAETKKSDAIVELDEIWAWMDARDSMNNETMTNIVLNSRKRGCLLIYTTQELRQADVRLRNNTDFIGVPKHVPSWDNKYGHDIIVLHILNKKMEVVNSFVFNAELYYDTYDTTEEISTTSDSEAFDDLITDIQDKAKDGEFNSKKEAVSFLTMNKDAMSVSKAERIVDEAWRRMR